MTMGGSQAQEKSYSAERFDIEVLVEEGIGAAGLAVLGEQIVGVGIRAQPGAERRRTDTASVVSTARTDDRGVPLPPIEKLCITVDEETPLKRIGVVESIVDDLGERRKGRLWSGRERLQ